MQRWKIVSMMGLMVMSLAGCSGGQVDVRPTVKPSATSTTQAETPVSNQPILRLNTQMHTAPIIRMSIDAQQRFLVTGSDDKTARVWDLKTGNLLKVLRPPIGDGNEGKISAVAISPDGDTIAIGGWFKAGYVGVGNLNIYLFSRQTGEIINKIIKLPEVVTHLIYSPDGRFLVACLGGKNGIKIYNQNQLIAEDKNYGDDSYWADFDAQGRLVTSSLDGKIRLYDKNFKLIQSVNPTGGKQPFGVRFNPNGDKVAVGFHDSTNVQILSGTDLNPLYDVDTKKISNGDLSKVAWSTDGKTLLAGGRYGTSGHKFFVSWSEAGKEQSQQWAASTDTIMDIQTLSNGRIIIAAQDPFWSISKQGVFKKTGQNVMMTMIEQKHDIIDFRAGEILLSNQGNSIQFSYYSRNKKPAQYSLSLKDRELQTQAKENKLSKPRIEGLKITDWLNSLTPKLNDKPLKIRINERSRSLAISQDNQHFILGTNWFLRFFDQNGKQLWEKPAPSDTWAVNIPPNGKMVVAAFGDGTIRWYRLSDGVELLAFFPHNDGKRWVLWTPSGYYAASAGAEELIGWHVNNGADRAADFFNVGQFRDQFYRPDVIDLMLETLDETQAVAQANAVQQRQVAELKLPPVVSVEQAKAFNSSEVTLHYQIRSPSSIKQLQVLVDGRPLQGFQSPRGIVVDNRYSLIVNLPERDLTLSVLAENQDGLFSQPVSLPLKWEGKPVAPNVIKPNLYVLAIGTGDYDDSGVNKLTFPSKDAQDVTTVWLAQQNQGLYQSVQTKTLVSPTRQAVLDSFEWIKTQPSQQDVAVIFLSGHGVNGRHQRYFYLPKDTNLDELKKTGVAFEDIRNTVKAIAGKVIFFIDTCHSGNATGDMFVTKDKNPVDVTQLANELSSAENGAIIYASSHGKQLSMESSLWQNGAFTKALVEGLNGKSDANQDGKITTNELDEYLSERVKELTNGKQTPVTTKPKMIPNLPIALTR